MNNDIKNKIIFYLSFGFTSGIFLISGYKFFNKLFKNSEEIFLEEIENIKKNLKEKIKVYVNLNENICVEILSLINKIFEYKYKELFEENDNERRELLKNNQIKEYENKVNITIINQKELLNKIINELFKELNIKNSYDEIQKILKRNFDFELEKLFYKYDKPLFLNKIKENKLKEAYFFYESVLTTEITMFKNEINYNSIKLENEITNNINSIENKLEFIKIKTNDKLFNKFNINERELIYLIFDTNLINNNEIKASHDRIKNLNQIFEEN